MGQLRVLIYAVIMCIFGATEAMKLNSWIPKTFRDGDDNSVSLPNLVPVEMLKNATLIQPKDGSLIQLKNESLIQPKNSSFIQPKYWSPAGAILSKQAGVCRSCGTVNRATRIVGGVETEVNEYPWQVALVYAGTNDVFCGGSVYNDLYILTAGHCAEASIDYWPVEVLLGAHNVDSPTSSQQRIPVAQVINHPYYNPTTLDNDIALLKLTRKATLSEKVKPACLPDPAANYDNIIAIASGWGSLTEGGSQPSSLMEVELPTMPNTQCHQYYGTSEITQNMICAGYVTGGKDTCQGDSGGPLAANVNNKWVLIGVTSWGYGCAQEGYPGVYTRVTKYLPWLASNAAAGTNNLCPSGSTTTSATTTTAAAVSGCKCGKVNRAVRIVGGVQTEIHEYPWQVALTQTGSNQPYCGGSIISNQWILTAAHCVYGDSPSDSKVVIGEHDWGTTSDTSVTQRKTIAQIIVHPNYNPDSQNNDMALIKLSTPITFPADNKIAPVCLPSAGNLYDNVQAVTTGWGTTSSGGSQPHQLYGVTVPTMSNTKCQTSYGTSSITSNMLCAGVDAGGKDSCQGDSGGPLVTSGNTAQTYMIQIGVVSWGYGCGSPGYPGVYARVNKYLDWIATNTAGSTKCPPP